MPERPEAPQEPIDDNEQRIRLLQINLNKSEKAHLDIINEEISKNFDIILIQEPFTTVFNAIRTPANFRPVFPAHRFGNQDQVRSVVWVNKKLDTKHWTELAIPGTNDITAIQLQGPYGTLSIFNIYNDCTHSRNEAALQEYIQNNANSILATENHHMIWAGDFNRHHPLWDRDEDVHLFTPQATREAEGLIELLATYDLAMALPKGIPTLQHMVTKRYSRPDNVFSTPGLSEHITICEVDPAIRPTSTDHFPIVTKILLPQGRVHSPPSYNFRETDWDNFRRELRRKLATVPNPPVITTPEQLNTVTGLLTQALQSTIEENVNKTKPRPDAKRWWNGDLRKRKKELNRLRANSYTFRAIADHPSHELYRFKSNQYGEAIIQAKREHWTNYLEEMTASDIWTANKFIKEPAGDGGCPRIPTLKSKNERGDDIIISNNNDKAKIFAKIFFPPAPPAPATQVHHEYPDPLPDPPQITKEQVQKHIAKLSPYKAHGPDGIPNVVLQRCVDMLSGRLTRIFRAVLELNTYYDPWREFTTVVLRKPGKPSYEVPKAYRPIALISTTAKVLSAIVAENLSRLVEVHHLLPKNHFGGRPGRSTADAVQYLVHKICETWRTNKVISVLFLDIEGAFPNAVTARLIHNLKRRRVPTAIVNFVEKLLHNRKTRLKFDDYISDIISITNGIGQGDPLSMLLYILYNADLLDLPDNPAEEDALGYVDDIALFSTGEDFDETTNRLRTMMIKEDGGLQWSRNHNSKFEVSKSAILHFSKKTIPDPDSESNRIPLPKPDLVLEGQTVKEVTSFKYLGIQIDANLRWKEQAQRATANATKWILQYRRLTRPSTGVKAKLMRQLYLAVALPKITYGIDIWYTPPSKPTGSTRNKGSVGALRNLQKIQRIATLAITGTLRTSPNDYVDVHANTLPMDLALLKACHNALVRSLTLPSSNPIHQVIRKAKQNPPTKHQGPFDKLLKLFSLATTTLETIHPSVTIREGDKRFITKIDNSREDSINSESLDDADYKVYSDGSGQDNGTGSAAILYEKGSHRPVRSLKKFLGTSDKHNTYEAEAAGAILAIWLLETTPETVGKRVSLYIDNQSIISGVLKPKATPGQYLLNILRSAANRVACNLTIRWISGHSKVKGNEEVDKLAKDAAAGRSSATVRLPHVLRNPLPTSASAVKQAFNSDLKQKWMTRWDASPRKPRVAQFGDSFPYSAFLKRVYSLTRKQSSLILQIRCGHLPLNAYLHRISRSETDRCQACENVQGGNPPMESVNHFIFDCPAHAEARNELITEIGRDEFHFPNIMSDIDRMKALITYINRSGRFRN
jgi:ribonuclease HI/endonuclease/exonuclease/phosphatase family metal-dependent hydrolase